MSRRFLKRLVITCYYQVSMEIMENSLIRLIRRFEKRSPSVVRGIGDDGAVVMLEEGRFVFVQDGLVENIHFEFSFIKPYYVGKKAIYVNVSDVLSMGAKPMYFLVTIGIPDRITKAQVLEVYRGINAAANDFNLVMLGGDTVSTGSDFFIDISMTGRLTGPDYLGRDKAEKGDLIGVTGYLGESAYGLFLLKKGMDKNKKGVKRFIERYKDPRPPYELWNELVKSGITNGMMDISDGLIIDLERMMAESKKSARVYMEDLPIPDMLKKASMEELALSGGEDYQFLFTFPKQRLPVIENIKGKGYHVSVIGEVTEGRGVKVFEKGKRRHITSKGYEHFRDREK
ncbi:MAG: thiamine-phosphate kinase [Syntrophorhabdaceae bacterium]|nr:thiamine-phosphate kinase [Syntrophorhabdaceae bacterium]